MKKILKAILLLVLVILIALAGHIEAESKAAHIDPVEGNPFVEPARMRVSCYCEHGTTATGVKTRYGIAAGKKDWLGYAVELNAINPDGSVGEFVGYFEFCDTGAGMDTDGDGKGDSIKNGQSIDIWINSLSEAYDWRDKYGDYMYVKIIKGDG